MSSEEPSRSPWERPTPGDWFLVVFLAGLSLGSWALLGRRPAGTTLVVDLPGQSQSYPLAEDRTLTLVGPLGASHVRVEGGRVRFTSSPCPEQRCVMEGWLARQGESAACLPNRIALRLEGAGALDALSR